MVSLSHGSEAKSNRNECLPRTFVTFWFGDQNLAIQNAKINPLIWAQMRPLSNSQVKYFQYSQFNYLVLFFPAHWSFIKLWLRTINVHKAMPRLLPWPSQCGTDHNKHIALLSIFPCSLWFTLEKCQTHQTHRTIHLWLRALPATQGHIFSSLFESWFSLLQSYLVLKKSSTQ